MRKPVDSADPNADHPHSELRNVVQQPSSPTVIGTANPAVASRVWNQVAESLEASGFAAAGPEYARLSQLLVSARATRNYETAADHEEWLLLKANAHRALTLLEPLYTAARTLVAADVITKS